MRKPDALLLALSLLAPIAGLALGCGDSSAEGAVAPAEPSAPEVRVRVRTARVEHAPLGASERMAGTVRAFREASVRAETGGRVLRRPAQRGELVEEGDVLIELDASRQELELRQAEANLRARRTDLEHARREHERGEQLVSRDAISAQRRDDLRHGLDSARDNHALALVARDTARRLLADTSIRAPIAGTVDDLLVDVGDYVAPGTPVARVLDLSRARIFGGATAEQAARLVPGTRARASFSALGGVSQEAELRSVARAADPADGTYRIELWIDDPDPSLRDGVVATLEFAPARGEASLVAPRAALMRRDGRSEVFAVEREQGAEGVARRRPVRTGRTGGERVEILDGLSAGEEVVVDGQFALHEGSRVVVEAPAAGADAATE